MNQARIKAFQEFSVSQKVRNLGLETILCQKKTNNAIVLGKVIEMSQYVNICECIKMLVASLKDAINENTENTNSFPRPEYREFSKNTERFPRPDHALCDITFYPAVVRIVQPCKRGNKFLFKFVYFLRAK